MTTSWSGLMNPAVTVVVASMAVSRARVRVGAMGARQMAAFFFQAEDGIRDGHVTRVQTCALPICRVLGPVVEYNYMGDPPRFARIAEAMGKETRNLHATDAAERAVDEVYQLTEDLNIPTLHQLGFTEDEIPMLAKIAHEDPQTIGNPREVDQAGYEQIYARAFEAGRR